MKFYDLKIQNHLLNGGKIKNTTFEGSYVIYIGDDCVIKKDNNEDYILKGQDLSSDKWEIVETKYNWDKIMQDGVLCVFWDDFEDKENPVVGCLTKKTAEGFYKSECYFSWKCCKPFNPADFNIAKNLKEYKK